MVDDFIRMSTGIPGLDEMIEGGFPFPSSILLAGGTGTGKTTFALQFLFEGAKRGEQGIYFTALSEPPQWMMRFASNFSFVDKSYIGKEIKYVDLANLFRTSGDRDPMHMLYKIEEYVMECMPQRIVIDPITAVGMMIKGNLREFLYDISSRLKNWQAVTLVTGEVHPDEEYPPQVAYTSDGILLLTNVEFGEARMKSLEVLKMRGTDHMSGRNTVDINSAGFSVQAGLKA